MNHKAGAQILKQALSIPLQTLYTCLGSSERPTRCHVFIHFTEPVRLPDIPLVQRKKDTWTVLEEPSTEAASPPLEYNDAMRKLKEKKTLLHNEYR